MTGGEAFVIGFFGAIGGTFGVCIGLLLVLLVVGILHGLFT